MIKIRSKKYKLDDFVKNKIYKLDDFVKNKIYILDDFVKNKIYKLADFVFFILISHMYLIYLSIKSKYLYIGCTFICYIIV
jgi:hypothetical protein